MARRQVSRQTELHLPSLPGERGAWRVLWLAERQRGRERVPGTPPKLSYYLSLSYHAVEKLTREGIDSTQELFSPSNGAVFRSQPSPLTRFPGDNNLR